MSCPFHNLPPEYFYALNVDVSIYVSVKLSGSDNYPLWQEQILCLLKSHNMAGLVDDTIFGPGASSQNIKTQYDNLLKAWIFRSISEELLGTVVHLGSAKEVWERLKSFCYPIMISQQDGQHTAIDMSYIDQRDETKKLFQATMMGDWLEVKSILKKNTDAATEEIKSDGSTVLHIAVASGHNHFMKKLVSFIEEEKVLDKALEKKRKDGSTTLHIAAIVGNTNAADLLVRKNPNLLQIKDNEGKFPLDKAYENINLDTIAYLLKTANDHPHPGDERVIDLLVHAISANRYDLAAEFVERFPQSAVEKDDVLMAVAKNFPVGLHYRERLIYPSRNTICRRMSQSSEICLKSFSFHPILKSFFGCKSPELSILDVPSKTLSFVYHWICFLMLMAYFPFFMLYLLLWKMASRLVPWVKHVENRKREWELATKVLELVCDKVDELEFSGTNHHPYYTRPLLEAARQDAYEVVEEILFRSSEAIQCTDENGYDIIQLAVIHRSEKTFNLIHDIGERKIHYRTRVDYSKNNILHLASRLAPSHKLNRVSGAPFQLQRELQWHEEVKKLLFPTYITKENIFGETPDMVFTREHENLAKEGETWMKTTAESSSITAALIIPIVFAAAITVPGGNNQETGKPIEKNIAFTIFAITDAISLFASATALLVFLSILTARFAEQDFLVSLPRRLIIGLCTLLISTIAMMVAFSTTLFLLFCQQKLWVLALICGLAFIPISFFVTLQSPLILDLFRLTYVPTFGKQRKSIRDRFRQNTSTTKH